MDLEVVALLQLLFRKSMGDHRTVIVDITSRSLIGKDKFKIIRPLAQRLISTKPKATSKYIKYAETELC